MAASAPRNMQPEPATWQPRAMWVTARLLCGAISFFFLAFLFAYFYLRSLDPNHGWKIGPVHPSMGLGVSIMVLFVLSAVVLRIGALRSADTVTVSVVAIVLALVAIVLQFVEYTQLDFGSSSVGYASV